jgi:pimeloyl-ACP methyl ester carboxylesterase
MSVVKCALFLALLAAAQTGLASPCEVDDFETKVSGVSQCLMMRRFGVADPEGMLVWLHGDLSSGGPANYHFQIAEKAAKEFAASKVLSVAMVRPGYPDGDGFSSTVDAAQGGRSDHYTKDNVSEVAGAIDHLRQRFKPQKLIVIGHSGGAATTAVILGLHPGLVDGALLVSCPCDLGAWRSGRKGKAWARSEDPIKWTEQVIARVVALTGERDDNTSPELARSYVQALKGRNIDAVFTMLPRETHNSALRSSEVSDGIRALLQ